MKVIVSWEDHDRIYEIGIIRFLQKMGIDADEQKIKTTAKKLLEQEEMNSGGSKEEREV